LLVCPPHRATAQLERSTEMYGIFYLIGVVVVILAVLNLIA
jgi:hypothetical protein